MKSRRVAGFVCACFCLCLGVSDLSAQIGSFTVFPHIANGDQGNGIWRTRFELVNNSPTLAQGDLVLFDDNGDPLVVGTTQGVGSQFHFSIPARAKAEIETDGSGPVKGGWAVADFNHGVVGSAVFSFSTNQGRMVTVGVLGTFAFGSFLAPAEARTGVALTNIYDSSNHLELRAFDTAGNLVSSASLTLNPGQHVAMIVKDLFPGLSSSFVGSIKIRSTNSFLSALAIGFVSNALFDAGYSISAIAYDDLATSYVGSFTSTAGTGTVFASDLEHSDSNMFSGTWTIVNQTLGTTLSGPLIGNVDDFGLLYSFVFELEAPGLGIAVATLDSSVFTGDIVDDGSGNSGTFTLTPSTLNTTIAWEDTPPLKAPDQPSKIATPFWRGIPKSINMKQRIFIR